MRWLYESETRRKKPKRNKSAPYRTVIPVRMQMGPPMILSVGLTPHPLTRATQP